eukprot:1156298-Pelagomonas_calceolata.AAC.4
MPRLHLHHCKTVSMCAFDSGEAQETGEPPFLAFLCLESMGTRLGVCTPQHAFRLNEARANLLFHCSS